MVSQQIVYQNVPTRLFLYDFSEIHVISQVKYVEG